MKERAMIDKGAMKKPVELPASPAGPSAAESREGLISSLEKVLQSLVGVQERMHEAIRWKLEAMRRVDVQQMSAASFREAELAAEAGELDRRRQEIVQRLCGQLGLPTSGRGEVTLRTIAARLEGDTRQHLLSLANVLRRRMLRTAEANRVVELVCVEMMDHFKRVFEVITTDGTDRATYSPQGKAAPAGRVQVLDAVG